MKAEVNWVLRQWVWSNQCDSACQIIEIQQLWGHHSCQVWLPAANCIVQTPVAALTSLAQPGYAAADESIYRATAARIADLLGQDTQLLSVIAEAA